MVTYLGSLVQSCNGKGRTMQRNIIGVCEVFTCTDHTGFAPAHGSVCFPGLHTQAPGYPAGVLSKPGLVFHALPRSKLLRFRFSGTSQGQSQLGMCFVSFPVPSSWATTCLQAHCPRWAVCLNHLPGPSHSLSWVCHKSTISGVLCISSAELISGCDPLHRCLLFRIPGRLS